jgi:hypothetical protein
MRICCTCRLEKKDDEFVRDRSQKDGFGKRCKECNNLSVTEYNNSHPNQHINCHYKRQYGITLEKYNEMFEEQKGSCAICGRHQTEFARRLAVDHDHNTMKIRALLCVKCNRLLGLAHDDISVLRSAIEYLEKHKENKEEA